MLDVLHRLRIEHNIFKDIEEGHPNIMVTCPFHAGGEEEVPSMGVYVGDGEKKGLANCFACGYKGSIETIIEDLGEDTEDYLGVESVRTINLSPARETLLDTHIQFTMNYTKAYPVYLAERGVNKETARAYDIGYKGDKVVFPIMNTYGEETGYITRSINSKDYKISYGTHKRFYGEQVLTREFPETREVFIVEGVFDVLTLYQIGLPALGLLGVGNNYQASELTNSKYRRIILLLDGDEAGREGARKLAESIKGKEVIVINLREGLDPNDMTEKQLKYLKENYLNERETRFNRRGIR